MNFITYLPQNDVTFVIVVKFETLYNVDKQFPSLEGVPNPNFVRERAGWFSMQKLTDKLVLLSLCLLALSLSEPKWLSIIVFLVAITTSSLNSYFETKLPLVLSIIYIVVCFIIPEFTLFLPLIVYDSAGMEKWYIRYLWGLTIPLPFISLGWQVAAVILLACGVAYLLQYRTEAGIKIQKAYFSLTDDAKEKATYLERENRELLEKQDYEIRLATLKERNRIAREIHDNVGHLLTRSLLQISALQVTNTTEGKPTEELELVKNTLTEAMDSIRDSVHDLHDESVNLKLQLETMIDGFKFCPTKLRYDAGELPIGLRTCFAAVVREALSNIARHSKANEATITITEHPAFYQLIVRDNGTEKMPTISKGIGLQNMAERVSDLGGVFRIDQDKGFKIFISIPKA